MTLYDINAQKSKEINADIRNILQLAEKLNRSKEKGELESEIQSISDDLASRSPNVARLVLKSLGSTYESAISTAWRKILGRQETPTNIWEQLGLVDPGSKLDILSSGAWSLNIPFVLRKPYISRDDTEYYIVDNPIKKEWVSKLAYVAPSQWKGALRSSMMLSIANELKDTADEKIYTSRRIQLCQLFGNEKEDAAMYLNRCLASIQVGEKPSNDNEAVQKEWKAAFREEISNVSKEFESKLKELGYRLGKIEGFRGRLYFHPTYFTRTSMELINPHDRESGAGKIPIQFECVPQGSPGTFTLLYVPMSQNGESSKQNFTQSISDMNLVAQGLYDMFLNFGFGAKTSSGFGVAFNGLQREEKGIIEIRLQSDVDRYGFDSFSHLTKIAKALDNKYSNSEGGGKDE